MYAHRYKGSPALGPAVGVVAGRLGRAVGRGDVDAVRVLALAVQEEWHGRPGPASVVAVGGGCLSAAAVTGQRVLRDGGERTGAATSPWLNRSLAGIRLLQSGVRN